MVLFVTWILFFFFTSLVVPCSNGLRGCSTEVLEDERLFLEPTNHYCSGHIKHPLCPICIILEFMAVLIAYLSHVADYNGHDDPIDGDSFAEDNARGR